MKAGVDLSTDSLEAHYLAGGNVMNVVRALIAADRAAEAENGVEISYTIPSEGTIIWFDMLAIPKDAPHPDNAHAFINYVLQPEVIAEVTNYVFYANPNAASVELVDLELIEHPSIYPPDDVKAKLCPDLVKSPKYDRLVTRAWTRFKTGQ